MKFRNADHLGENESLQTDICIVGAGAAGITLALELEQSRHRVMLLESGDAEPLVAADRLNDIEIAGHPLHVDGPVRRRCFGGTTNSTFGRSVLLDAIDFESRPWLGVDGWPLAEAELRRFYPRTAEILGLPKPEWLHRERWSGYPLVHDISTHDLAVRIHQWGKYINFRRAWGERIRRSERVEVILRATAVSCQAGPDGASISHLAVRGLNGGHFIVRARVFVLACGGLENARLLLLSSLERSAPSINWDMVGRYYMNHPRAENIARLRLNGARPRLRESARRLVMHRARLAKARLQFSFSPAEELQRREVLLNVSSFFYAVSDERARSARRALLELKNSGTAAEENYLKRLAQVSRNLPILAAGAVHQLLLKPFRPDHLVVVDQCEQLPDPESRVMLGEARDMFGSPVLRLDWRIDPATTRSLRRLHGLMARMCSTLGLGTLESRLLDDPDWIPPYQDCAHPMGATRMSQSDRAGVVDTHCRVHGMRNLFVAGSSVFPVGGQANPTFTIIALAVRLASFLKNRV